MSRLNDISRVYNRDHTAMYNTKLDDPDTEKYVKWIQEGSKKAGRDLEKDNFDYDMRGYYKSGGQLEGGHLPDTYKKPSHPTFSDQSIYHGADGHEGGVWGKEGNAFVPGATNLRFHTQEELDKYFKEVEPNTRMLKR